jgi:hypothetical protein
MMLKIGSANNTNDAPLMHAGPCKGFQFFKGRPGFGKVHSPQRSCQADAQGLGRIRMQKKRARSGPLRLPCVSPALRGLRRSR